MLQASSDCVILCVLNVKLIMVIMSCEGHGRARSQLRHFRCNTYAINAFPCNLSDGSCVI